MFTLSNQNIHVWYVTLPESQSIIEHYSRFLSYEEKQRAQRFKFEVDKNKYKFMHGILREILGEYLIKPPDTIIIYRNNYGKPQFINSSIHQFIEFNMSSSKNLVVLAFAHSRNVGIDIEYINRELQIDEIIPSLLSPDEVYIFEHIDCSERLMFVLRLWTLKEAFVKAKGIGMFMPFEHISFTIDSCGNPSLVKIFNENNISNWNFKQLKFKEYIGALAYDGIDARIVQREYPISQMSARQFD